MRNKKLHIDELEKTAEFLRLEIQTARKELEGQPLSVEYDHGGGQCGVRENPAYTAFAKILKSYQAVITQLDALTRKDDNDEEMRKQTGKLLQFEKRFKTG